MSAATTQPDERDRLLYELPTNIVVAAGAGTGKTHRLSGLFVHLVCGLTDVARPDGAEGPLPPAAIVATTFTREAASEMRARIEGRLRRLAAEPLDALASDAECGAWADELLRTARRRDVAAPSREVFRAALEGLPRATITTFHSWAGELVRAHPVEARVPPGFALLDPDDAELLVERATHDAIGAWVDDTTREGVLERREAIRRLLVSGVDALVPAVRNALARSAEEGVDASALLLVDGELEVARARARRRALLDALGRAVSLRCAPGARTNGREDDVRAALIEAGAAMAALERGADAPGAAERFGAAVKEIHSQLKAGHLADVRAPIEDILASARGGSIQKNATAIADAPERTQAAHALARAARSLLVDVERRVATAKRRLRALDFGDVLRRARDLLLHSPEVQLDVARSIGALLVDEFQDTNALQRDLVYLVRQSPEAIAHRSPGAPADPRTLSPTGLFLVGDRKQSIYGFRGADVGVFQQIALDLAADDARALLGVAGEPHGASQASDEGRRGRVVTLDVNRRSVDEVLQFVNAFSAADMRGHDALAEVEQVVFQPELEALRAVRRGHAGEGEPRPRVVVPTISVPDDVSQGRLDVSADLLTSLAVAGELRALLADPAAFGLDEKLRARDVAILIRTYAALPGLEFALSLHGLEYAVAAGRGLFATSEAADLEALVRVALDRRDRHALLALLRGPFVSLSDGALLSLVGAHGLELPRSAADARGLDEGEVRRLDCLLSALDLLERHGARLGAGAALGRALGELRVEETLALLPAGEARIGDLRRLVTLADGFPTGLPAYARFLERGRAGDLDEARGALFDEEHDAIRVLTIHASKGLEFRVVAVLQLEHVGPTSIPGPVLCARAGGGLGLAARVERGGVRDLGVGGRALHDRALAADRAERQRLTYVALTRARDLLYVVATPRTRAHDEASAAASVSRLLARAPTLAETKVLTPSLEPPANAARVELPEPQPAYGEGPLVASPRGSVVVTTALADFHSCARRFRLLHVVGLPEQAPRARAFELAARSDEAPLDVDELDVDAPPNEPEPDAIPLTMPVGPLPTDPRLQGVLAHLALERAPLTAVGVAALPWAEQFLRDEGWDPASAEGAKVARRIARFLGSTYAQTLRDEQVRIARERAFVVELPSGVALRGTIDLVVVRPRPGGARIEIVDHKSGEGSRADLRRYAFQLRAYAAACAHGALSDLVPGGVVEIVAGLVFLGGGDGEPIWLDDGSHLGTAEAVARIDDVARALLDARVRGEWPGVPAARCRELRCGFFPLCHPPDER